MTRGPGGWRRRAAGLLALSLLAGGTARGGEKPKHRDAAPAAAAGGGALPPGVLASVGDVRITAEQIEEKARGRLLPLQAQEYDVRRQVLDDLIADVLLEREAAARGVGLDALLQQEVDAKAGEVPEAETKALYERVKGRFPGKPEEELMGEIRAEQARRLREGRRGEFVRELRAKAWVRVALEPPRIAVDTAGAPARGGQDAPVTLVEFSDFQCPYCGRVAPTLKQLEERYGDKLKVVFRDFPLPMHPQAPKAAEAARCAGAQGKFWEMHDRLFADQSKLQVADLKQHAAELGLEAPRFDQCLDSGSEAAAMQRDVEEGARYGISGTPTFFINGRYLSGAQPYAGFARVIDEELERAGVAVPPPPPPTPTPAPSPTPAAPPSPPAKPEG